MKQSAVDPVSGRIDVSILTTGISVSERQRNSQLKELLWKYIESKGKVPTLNYQKVLSEFKDRTTDIVSTVFK